MRDSDKFRGCLIGGAAGDALGYAVEFIWEEDIFRRYGERGITAYELSGGKALFSDDTQMTLFTAEGLTEAAGGDCIRAVNNSYLNWLQTQWDGYPAKKRYGRSRLLDVPEIYSRRAPGNTCLSALEAGGMGTPENPINHSKGCGGVMRVAPVGLYFNDRGMDDGEVCRLGARAAALTHGHPLGWIPAGMLAVIVHALSQDGATVQEAVRRSAAAAKEAFSGEEALGAMLALIDRAEALSGDRLPDDLEAIHQLGEGWVGEEALAIAVYCALKYPDDFDAALIASVNHNGDSDSTGAVTGNILGARLGLAGIPAKYTGQLELKGLILDTADALRRG